MTQKSFLFAGSALAVLVATYPAVAAQPTLDQRVRVLEQMLGVPPRPNDTRPLEQRVRDLEAFVRERNAAAAAPAATQAATQAATAAVEQATQASSERLDKVEMRLDDKDTADTARLTRLSTLEQQFADTVWSFDNGRPTVTSADQRFTMAIRGRFQFDSAFFEQRSNVNVVTATRDVQFKDLASGSVMRRAYLGIEGRLFQEFWYEYRMDFGGSNAEGTNPLVNLARISWNYGNVAYPAEPHFRINAGFIQPIMTYGDSVSSGSVTFLERDQSVNVATTGYGGQEPRRGIELTFQQSDLFRPGDNLVVSGAFTGQQGTAPAGAPNNTSDEGTQIFGRIAYRVWSDGFSNVQIGATGAHITNLTGNAVPGAPRTITLQDRPEIRVDGNRLVSTGAINATGGDLYGFEAAMNLRNFYLAGEYFHYGIDRDIHCTGCIVASSPDFSAWYIEGTWILTGETKTYQANATNNEMATFNNPRVITPFSFVGGTWGAWELAARYSDLNLNWHAGTLGTTCTGILVGCVRGGEQKIWTLGLNWYLNNTVRMLLDYEFVDVNKLGSSGSQNGKQIGQNFDVVSMRLQFSN